MLRSLIPGALILAALAPTFPWNAALAQGAAKLPAPAAGKYGCFTMTGMPDMDMQFQPLNPQAGALGYVIKPTFTPEVMASAIGNFQLDGKGKYQYYDMAGKPLGRGEYTYDTRLNRPRFSGPLADNKTFRLAGYKVYSSGEFTIYFLVGQSAHSCTTFVKGNPLPQVKAPNAPLKGVLTVGGSSKVFDISLDTGKVVWSAEGAAAQRLPGGLMAYGLPGPSDQPGQLVLARGQGEVLARVKDITWDRYNTSLVMNPDGTRILVHEGITKVDKPGSLFGYEQIPPRWKLVTPSGQVLGFTAETFTGVQGPSEHPAFLPDGRILMPREDDHSLYIYDANLRGPRLFVPQPSRMPVVSPSGTRVAMLRGEQIVVTDVSGKDLRRISPPQGARVSAMTFSPDSQTLGLVLNTGSAAREYLASVGVDRGEVSWIRDTSGEAVELGGTGWRLSWWTGQSSLPAPWKGGVPQGSVTPAANPPSASASTSPPDTAKSPTPVASATPGRPATPASGGAGSAPPWPSWLPQGRVTLGKRIDGQLNLTLDMTDGDRRGIGGATRAGTQDMVSAFIAQGGRKVLFVQPGDGSTLLCLIS